MNTQRECSKSPGYILLILQGLDTIKLHQKQLLENLCEVKFSVTHADKCFGVGNFNMYFIRVKRFKYNR